MRTNFSRTSKCRNNFATVGVTEFSFNINFRIQEKKVKFSFIVVRAPLFIGVRSWLMKTEVEKQCVSVCAASLRPHAGYHPK